MKNYILCFIFILTIGCKNNPKKEQFKNIDFTKKDTIYILFNNKDSLNKVSKFKQLHYKDQNPKYYWIIYDYLVYWKEKASKKLVEELYGKEYIKTNGIRLTDEYRHLLYDDDYDYSFWFGTYKVFPEYPEFDDSQIYGNSEILKRHKSFLQKHKNDIIDG